MPGHYDVLSSPPVENALGVVSQEQDHANEKARRPADCLRNVVEIYSQLISEHWREYDECDQDQHPVGLKPREWTRYDIGQDADRDVSAVKRWEGETY